MLLKQCYTAVGDDMDASVIGLIAVFVGGVIGVAGSWGPHYWEQKRARARARAIALAYVDGVLGVERHRQYSARKKQRLEDMKSGHERPLPKLFGAEHYPNPTQIALQKAVIEQLIQLKPDVAGDVALFLSMCDGIDGDDEAMATGKLDDLTHQQKIQMLEEHLDFRAQMLALGRQLVCKLGDKATRKENPQRGMAQSVES